jgi:hypothetical protein
VRYLGATGAATPEVATTGAAVAFAVSFAKEAGGMKRNMLPLFLVVINWRPGI